MTPVHQNTPHATVAIPASQPFETPRAPQGKSGLALVDPPALSAGSQRAEVRGKLADLDEVVRALRELEASKAPASVVSKSLFLNKDSPLIPQNGSTEPGTNRLDNVLKFYGIVPAAPKTPAQLQAAMNAAQDTRSEISLGLDDASSQVDGLLQESNDQAISNWVSEQEAKYKKPLLGILTEGLAPQALEKAQGTPATVLELMLKSPKAHDLVQLLLSRLGGAEFALDGITSPAVKTRLLIKALTLSLDPLQGRRPGTIAGFQLASSEHWNKSYPAINSAFRQHLVDARQLSAAQAHVAAYILRPQFPADFAVRDTPAALGYRGTTVSVNFQHGVRLAEALEPGSSRRMGFQDLIDLPGKLSEQATTDGQWALIASTRIPATLDWAVAQGVIPQKDAYSQEDIDTAVAALDAHVGTVVKATEQLAADVPLRKDYFERMDKGTSRTEVLSLISPLFTLYRHLNGEKITPADVSYRYPVYDESTFKTTFDKYLTDTKTAYAELVRSHLSELGTKDRTAIEQGEVTVFALRTKPDSDKETDEDKKAATTRPAFILKAVHEGQTSYYEMNPVKGIARRRDDLKPILESYNPAEKNYGKDFISIEHSADGVPSEELVVRNTRPQSKVEFKKQWAAYTSGKGPKPKDFSIVIPRKLAHFPASSTGPKGAVPQTLTSERAAAIAKTVTDDLFYVDEDNLQQWAASDPARESAAKKDDEKFWERVKGTGQMVIPFWGGIENLVKGNTKQGVLDLVSDGLLTFAGPAGKFAAGSVRLVSSAGKIGVRALLPKFGPLIKKFAVSVARNLNPLDPLMPAFKLNSGKSLTWRGLDNSAIGAGIAKFRQSSAFKLPGRGRYAISSQIPVTPRPLAQGPTLRVPEGISSDQARVLNRHKYSDVVVGDDVYRYNPQKPESLIKLGGPDHIGPFEGFVTTCGGGAGRAKRDLNDLCYTKQIEPGGTPVFQEAQALEHRRLIPGSGPAKGPRTVVHEHRRYRVNEAGNQELLPMASVQPVTYKSRTTGALVNEPDFGYDDFGVPRAINEDTVVLKMDAISDLSNDQRVVRGVKVNHDGHHYVVVEADTGVHYYAELSGNGQLDFHRMTRSDPLDVQFTELYDQYKDIYGFAAQGLPDNQLVVLPSLESLVKKIAADEPMSPAEVNHLADVLRGLSPEKKREVLMGVYAAGSNPGHVVVAAKPVRLTPIDKPADFSQLPSEQQNRLYAEGSRKAVDDQFQATGIRSANQQVPGLAGEAVRSETATQMVSWLYTRTGAPNYSEMVLKTGAGNCDQMAKVAVDTINASGGNARIAQVKGHTFAIVGGPPGMPRSKGFVETQWDEAWVVDPWAGITCRAADYPAQFKARMQEWSESGRRILISNGETPPRSVWSDPMEPRWISATVDGETQVF